MIVLVCGGRTFNDKELLFTVLDTLTITRLIHGGARGADALTGRYARARGIPYDVFEADWHRHGRASGPIRNQRMLDEAHPNLVIAFPGGRGTNDMIRRALKAKITVRSIERKNPCL